MKSRNNEAAPRNLKKLSINVPEEMGERIKRLAFEQNISLSSFIEVAVDQFLDGKNDAQLGRTAKRKGATLRRRF